MFASVEFSLNGESRSASAPSDTPLLYILRNDFGLRAAKFGCGLGQCGACTVLIDGRPLQSCDVPLWSVKGKSVVTLEALRATREGAKLQGAFVAEQAAQCGYCIPGILVSACSLLQGSSTPTETDIGTALERHLCRCGTHVRILRAIRRAAQELAS